MPPRSSLGWRRRSAGRGHTGFGPVEVVRITGYLETNFAARRVPDHAPRALQRVRLRRVALAAGGDDVAVAMDEPPAVLFGRVAEDLEPREALRGTRRDLDDLLGVRGFGLGLGVGLAVRPSDSISNSTPAPVVSSSISCSKPLSRTSGAPARTGRIAHRIRARRVRRRRALLRLPEDARHLGLGSGVLGFEKVLSAIRAPRLSGA